VSLNRIVVKKATAILVALASLGLGVIGTALSTLYEQNEWILFQGETFKVSYGFPLAWMGYSQNYPPIHLDPPQWPFGPIVIPLKTYWFSLGSLLLDAAFWFAISFFVCGTTMKSVKILLRTIASNVVVTYFLASASFSVVGLSLNLFSYENLGLRLYGFGLFLIAATFYQVLVRERRTSKKHFPAIS
jgi:hypothetical protein